jgi:hypothetical protein
VGRDRRARYPAARWNPEAGPAGGYDRDAKRLGGVSGFQAFDAGREVGHVGFQVGDPAVQLALRELDHGPHFREFSAHRLCVAIQPLVRPHDTFGHELNFGSQALRHDVEVTLGLGGFLVEVALGFNRFLIEVVLGLDSLLVEVVLAFGRLFVEVAKNLFHLVLGHLQVLLLASASPSS